MLSYQLKQKDSAAFYKEQFGRIMAAMDWSGWRAPSPEEAIFSIGPHDGQNFIDKYYHADLGRASALPKTAMAISARCWK